MRLKDQITVEMIKEALVKCGNKKKKSAESLGISYQLFRRLEIAFGISPKHKAYKQIALDRKLEKQVIDTRYE